MTGVEKPIDLPHLDCTKQHNKEQIIRYAQIECKKLINEFLDVQKNSNNVVKYTRGASKDQWYSKAIDLILSLPMDEYIKESIAEKTHRYSIQQVRKIVEYWEYSPIEFGGFYIDDEETVKILDDELVSTITLMLNLLGFGDMLSEYTLEKRKTQQETFEFWELDPETTNVKTLSLEEKLYLIAHEHEEVDVDQPCTRLLQLEALSGGSRIQELMASGEGDNSERLLRASESFLKELMALSKVEMQIVALLRHFTHLVTMMGDDARDFLIKSVTIALNRGLKKDAELEIDLLRKGFESLLKRNDGSTKIVNIILTEEEIAEQNIGMVITGLHMGPNGSFAPSPHRPRNFLDENNDENDDELKAKHMLDID